MSTFRPQYLHVYFGWSCSHCTNVTILILRYSTKMFTDVSSEILFFLPQTTVQLLWKHENNNTNNFTERCNLMHGHHSSLLTSVHAVHTEKSWPGLIVLPGERQRHVTASVLHIHDRGSPHKYVWRNHTSSYNTCMWLEIESMLQQWSVVAERSSAPDSSPGVVRKPECGFDSR